MRLMYGALNLTLRDPNGELSVPQICDEVDLPIDAFLELFQNPHECLHAALDMLAGDLLEIVADPDLVSEEWPLAVCRALERLTTYLAANPERTVSLALSSTVAGIDTLEHVANLDREIATLLTEGAPCAPLHPIAPEGIAGALSHTLYTEAVSDRAHLLPVFVEHHSYVVLAPYLGPEAAVRAIIENRPGGAAPRAPRDS